MTKDGHGAHRTDALRVVCIDGVRRVRYRCVACGFENVTEYDADGFQPSADGKRGWLPGMYGYQVGRARCCYCLFVNGLRIVGACADYWPHGSVWIGPDESAGEVGDE